MEKGVLIGKGRSAEVYEWGEFQALKLFYQGYRPEWIMYEAEMGRIVSEAGVPAPAVFGMVELEGRTGLVYERITGSSMLHQVQSSPLQLRKCARDMARLQHATHGCTTTILPRQKDNLEHAIMDARGILQDKAQTICKMLESLPEGDSICHGDFHPDNIVVTEDGCRAIDWNNANVGNPLCDVARTSLMFQSPFNPLQQSWIMAAALRAARTIWNRVYLNEYCRLSHAKREDIHRWMLPVAAARMREDVPGERAWLMELIDDRLRAYA